MKYRKWTALFCFTTSILIVSITLFSWQVGAQFTQKQQPFEGEPGGQDSARMRPAETRADGMQINWRALGLTREQREQMQQLRRTFQVDTAGIRKELQFLGRDLRTEMAKDPVDRAKIDSVLGEIGQLKQRLSEAATQNLLAIKELLSPEQREKLADLQQQLPPELRAVRLDPAQRSQIQELIKNSRQANRDLLEELRELKGDLRDLLLSPDEIEMDQLEQLQAEIAEKEFTLEKARVENLLEIRDVLTPEQRERLKNSRSNRQKALPRKRK